MDEDDGDFVFYGTPIEREEDTSARKRKAIADAGQLRSLPTWKQEVRDEEGRRRFHGAFTGGYSAGYYNTVGSKEGWAPQTFTSSRKSRAEVKQQSIHSFLDDEDIKGMGGHALETSSQFDTFGFTAAEVARKQADKEQQKRPSAIPGPAPDEIVLPADNSIGVKLLLKMGWRRGHSVKETHADSLYDARREARKAFLAFSVNKDESEFSESEMSKTASEDLNTRNTDGLSHSTPVFVLYPKQDLHGLGYDPFKHAPEFRDRKRIRDSRIKDQGVKTNVSARGKSLDSNSGKYAPGFGIGALEELDVEDEDIYASGLEYVGMEVEEDEPSKVNIGDKLKLQYRKKGVLSGFKIASSSDYNLDRFHPPIIPPDFEPFHKFTTPIGSVDKFAESPPEEVPPPEDNSLRLLIDGFATLVARCGKLFEDISREKNRSNPLFSFLSGGNGHNYYARKLWEAKQRSINQKSLLDLKSVPSDRKMTSESRGRILGEKPLERSSKDLAASVTSKEVIHLQSNLSDTFTQPATVVDFTERAKPFKDDPAKQERFEKFLKDKYQGGLRSTSSGGTSTMSETVRARERLDFEAAAEAIEKGKWNTKTYLTLTQQHVEFPGTGDSRFVPSTGVEKQDTSQDEEKMINKIYPKREEFQWRPSPILCKRFDLIDPFMGKPPPAPRARSKMDTLIFMPDSVLNVKKAEADAPSSDMLPGFQTQQQETGKQLNTEEPDIELDATSVQRPVDLYKAIFSDDSDDEVDNASVNKVGDLEKKTGGVNTTLNRLVAGDFLESLGKELGLEVPPDSTTSLISTNSFTSLTETVGRTDIVTSSTKASTKAEAASGLGISNSCGNMTASLDFDVKNAASKMHSATANEVSPADGDESNDAKSKREDPNITTIHAANFSDPEEAKVKTERKGHRSRKHKSRSRRRRSSSPSDSDSSGHHRYHEHKKSRSDTRDSAKEKTRKKSSHERHKSSRSPTKYMRRGSDRDLSDDERKDRRSKDKRKHGHRKYR